MNLRQLAFCDFYRYDSSPIWNLHRDYFLNRGLAAWSNGEVPYSGISNYVEAFKKALLVIENIQIQNIYQNNVRDIEEIQILEVGAGFGEFAKNFIDAFDYICKGRGLDYSSKLNYSISDFAAKTLEELKNSGRLDRYLDRISFLELDVLEVPLSKENSFDAIIANYLLDQLPARVFAYSQGRFLEKYISLRLSPDEYLRRNPKIKISKFIKKIPKKIEFRKIDINHEVKQDHLETLETCFRKNSDSTVVYSYGALKACNQLLKLLKTNGVLVCSDFVAPTKPGVDNYEPCYYGNSIAHPVNFELIFKYFTKGSQAVLIYEDPIKPLHTLILTRPDFENSLALGKIYKDVYYKNRLLRALYRFLVELKFSLVLLFLILLIQFVIANLK